MSHGYSLPPSWPKGGGGSCSINAGEVISGGGAGGDGQVTIVAYAGGGGAGPQPVSEAQQAANLLLTEIIPLLCKLPLEQLAAIPELHALEEQRRALVVLGELKQRREK